MNQALYELWMMDYGNYGGALYIYFTSSDDTQDTIHFFCADGKIRRDGDGKDNNIDVFDGIELFFRYSSGTIRFRFIQLDGNFTYLDEITFRINED